MKKIAIIAAAVLLLAVCSSMVSAVQWNHVSSPGAGHMAVDPSGNLWLVTNSKLCKWVNNHWESENLPNYANHDQTDLVFSSDGTPHVISCDIVNGGYNPQFSIGYMSKTASGWTHETVYSNLTNVAQTCSGAIDANGNAYIAFATEWNKQALYVAKRNADGTWKNDPVDTGYNAAWWPEIKIDPSGKVWVAYTTGNTDDLRVASKSPNGSWIFTTLDSYGTTGWEPRLEIDSNGRKTYAYYSSTEGAYHLICERANGTLVRLTAPGRTNSAHQLDLTMMGDGTPLLAYTLNLTSTYDMPSPIYCAWYKDLETPVIFPVGDYEMFQPYGYKNYEERAQAVGSTLFINAIRADGTTETWWTTVPEPSSIIALFTGIAGLGLIRRRK